ncbi:hypothetical protein [Ideonella sp.]|uniref:hypothetical protein n=1 Tax=Ideonella sp. TaxID=1929293 RepID=UPI003BB7074F
MKPPAILNRYLYIALALLGMAYAVLWYNRTQTAPVGIHLPATPAPEVAKVEFEPLIVDLPLQVYKPAAKQKLKLPAHVQADAKQHVVASTRTAPDERPHTVTTVLDSGTGEFTTYDRAEPLPWIEASTRRHFGAYIGAMNGEQAIAITARQEALRIKGVKVEAIAIGTASQSERVGFLGVGVSW